MKKPFFSIIVAVYNAAETIEHCIHSIAKQSFKNYELLVIDAKSKDGTVDLIKKNTEKIDYWISEKDQGIHQAWNKAIKMASGEWVLFLGADDFLLNKDILNRAFKVLNRLDSSILIAYGKVALIDNNSNIFSIAGKPWPEVQNQFKHKMSIPHQGTFHRREFFTIYGNFNESFKIAGDYEILLRHLKNHKPFYISNIILTGMRQGGLSNKVENIFLILKEFNKAKKLNQIPYSAIPFDYLKACIYFSMHKILPSYIMVYTLTIYRKLKYRL